jgi:hypothetical protein
MINEVWTFTVPDIIWVTKPVLYGIGVRKVWDTLILEIPVETEKALRKMNGFDIQDYILMRIKEHISAKIFAILVGKNESRKITIATTNLVQDVMLWKDVRIRWLTDTKNFVYADMTGSLKHYKNKKDIAYLNHTDKLLIYVPWYITEYCFNWLMRDIDSLAIEDSIENLLNTYIQNEAKGHAITIQICDLRSWKKEKTHQFR